MSEENLKPGETKHRPIHILEFFNELVQIDESRGSIEVIINCGGLIITGTLIGGAEYYEGMHSNLDHNTHLQKLLDRIKQESENYKNDELLIESDYLYMKNAKYLLSPEKTAPHNGCLWSGKIKDITGFCLGELVQTEVTQ